MFEIRGRPQTIMVFVGDAGGAEWMRGPLWASRVPQGSYQGQYDRNEADTNRIARGTPTRVPTPHPLLPRPYKTGAYRTAPFFGYYCCLVVTARISGALSTMRGAT